MHVGFTSADHPTRSVFTPMRCDWQGTVPNDWLAYRRAERRKTLKSAPSAREDYKDGAIPRSEASPAGKIAVLLRGGLRIVRVILITIPILSQGVSWLKFFREVESIVASGVQEWWLPFGGDGRRGCTSGDSAR